MLASRFVRFGIFAATGSLLLSACSSDSSNPAPGSTPDASASGGTAGASGGAGGGGKTSSGGGGGVAGNGTGGAGTGGRDSDASTGDASSAGGAAEAGVDAASAGGATSDASTLDAGTGGATTTDSGSSGPKCGSAPYARLWVGGGTLLDHPTGEISVSGSSCPSAVLHLTPKTPGTPPGQTGIDAQFLDVSDQVPFHLRATQTGSLPLVTQELLPDGSSLVAQLLGYAALVNVNMIATDSGLDALDATWGGGTRAMLLLQVAPLQGATTPCNVGTGVTVTVNGHSEAVGGNGATPIVTIAGTYGTPIFFTTTGTSATPEFVTLTVTKTGCTVKTTGYDASPGVQTSFTGRYPVEAGAVTWGVAAIAN